MDRILEISLIVMASLPVVGIATVVVRELVYRVRKLVLGQQKDTDLYPGGW